jgi:hypothetical protein
MSDTPKGKEGRSVKLPPIYFLQYRDGTRLGDKIPGSKYLRAFCERCHFPIRVSRERFVQWQKKLGSTNSKTVPFLCDNCGSGASSSRNFAKHTPSQRNKGQTHDNH